MTAPLCSANKVPLVSRSAAFIEFAAALDLYVGRGKRYSVKQLSNATGVPDRRIECARYDPEHEEFRPLDLGHVLSISRFLGPEFTTEWLKLADQGAFWLPDVEDTPPGAIAADNSDDNAVIVRAALDGEFDSDEKKVLRPVGLRMVARGQQLVAISRAAAA
jgi:hypothetical protein